MSLQYILCIYYVTHVQYNTRPPLSSTPPGASSSLLHIDDQDLYLGVLLSESHFVRVENVFSFFFDATAGFFHQHCGETYYLYFFFYILLSPPRISLNIITRFVYLSPHWRCVFSRAYASAYNNHWRCCVDVGWRK